MIRVAIVEDDEKDSALLEKYLAEYGKENGEAFSVDVFADPLVFLGQYDASYDIVFMDIELPDMNGMQASARLRKTDEDVMIIFVTNMAQFAVKGYEVDAFDFVIKPVAYNDFAIRLRRALRRLSRRADLGLRVKDYDGSMRIVGITSVQYIEVADHSLKYHTDAGVTESRGRLDDLEKTLEGKGFFRCNRCYLVNLRYVTSVEGDDLVVAGNRLKIARPRKKEFMKAFAAYYGGSA